MKKEFSRAEMLEIMPGVRVGVNSNKMEILEIHYSADPRKDAEWVEREANSGIYGAAGGVSGSAWQEEQEINFDVVEGLPAFPSWNPAVHVVDMDVDLSCKIRLSFDFGGTNPTVCLFSALFPDNHLHVFAEHYASNARVRWHKEQIYQILKSRIRNFGEISEIVDFAVGDPTGKAFMIEYAQEPMPIYITGQLGPERKKNKMPPLNDHKAGFAKINAMLYLRSECCGRVFYGPLEKCPLPTCKKKLLPRPSLTVSPSCKNLISEIPKQVFETPTRYEYQIDESRIKRIPHDTIDTLRYKVVATTEWQSDIKAEERFPEQKTAFNARWRSARKRKQKVALYNYFYDEGHEETQYAGV